MYVKYYQILTVCKMVNILSTCNSQTGMQKYCQRNTHQYLMNSNNSIFVSKLIRITISKKKYITFCIVTYGTVTDL